MVARIKAIPHRKVPTKRTTNCPNCGVQTRIYKTDGWKEPYYISHCGETTIFHHPVIDKNGCNSFV